MRGIGRRSLTRRRDGRAVPFWPTVPMAIAPFPTTRRSVVLALASTDEAERTRAFDTLVACYWKPLYKFARVAWRRSSEDAEDLTQSFFARAFEKESLAAYDVAKASF